MEPPECPVCLQTYDATATVPRVLACGHSTCEACLRLLPARAAVPSTARCPACNQVVPLPSNPSSLPKNIDLLRLFDSNPNPDPILRSDADPSPTQDVLFFPWAHEAFVAQWNPWILPQDSISISISESQERETYGNGTVLCELGRPWFLVKDQKVGTFSICEVCAETNSLRLSYKARILSSLYRLDEKRRTQLGFLLEASWRQSHVISRIYGLWMDSTCEDSGLVLVSERFDTGVWGVLGLEDGERYDLGMVVVEMCEALMGLHSNGIVCGCLWPSCFGFNDFGHCILDLRSVLMMARRIGESGMDFDKEEGVVLVSPEVFVSFHDGDSSSVCGFEGGLVGYGSDVWSLGLILVMLLSGSHELETEFVESYNCLLSCKSGNCGNSFMCRYEVWRERVISKLETLFSGTRYETLTGILSSCLSNEPQERPPVIDTWHCVRSLFFKPQDDGPAAFRVMEPKGKSVGCLVLGGLCSVSKPSNNVALQNENHKEPNKRSDVDLAGSSLTESNHLQEEKVGDGAKVLNGHSFKSCTLDGHTDSITGLAVGGGFLFSSSLDKTISVWSLKDFSHTQTLRGHEHRIMAIIVVETSQPLCISGDSGSGICIWSIGTSTEQEPLKKWSVHNDWRYTGVHSLAVSDTGYIYSGSGDKSIKAWSMQDYSLAYTMAGHKSTISALLIADGILYSGSWDGTIRLWWLSDHSPLAILGDETPGNLSAVLSLSMNSRLLVSSYENGSIKIWRDDLLVKSMQIQNLAIFASYLDKRWLFTGGWDKIVDIQEVSENELQVDLSPIASVCCDSVISSLTYWHGNLFVGLSNKQIKVYTTDPAANYMV